MDQKAIGAFLRQLRQENGLTQQQLAEKLGVSNRSVSRWETGATMPDFDLLMELAKYYGVGVGEILDGRPREEPASDKTERLLRQVAEYESAGLLAYSRQVRRMFVAAVACMGVFAAIDLAGLWNAQPYEAAGNIALGFVLGTLITGILYTSGKLAKVKAARRRPNRRQAQ